MENHHHQGYVRHTIVPMRTQRIFQMVAGYEDANDCNSLKNDVFLKIVTIPVYRLLMLSHG